MVLRNASLARTSSFKYHLPGLQLNTVLDNTLFAGHFDSSSPMFLSSHLPSIRRYVLLTLRSLASLLLGYSSIKVSSN